MAYVNNFCRGWPVTRFGVPPPAPALGLSQDARAKIGALVGLVVVGGAVLYGGVRLGGYIGGKKHHTTGLVAGGVLAALPAYAAGIIAAMVGWGLASGQS